MEETKCTNVRAGAERPGGKKRGARKRGETREEEIVEGKEATRRGEMCIKTKTEMGLVTAMVGAAGLALSLGPLYSHPQEAGPLRARKRVACKSGVGEGWACLSKVVGLMTAG